MLVIEILIAISCIFLVYELYMTIKMRREYTNEIIQEELSEELEVTKKDVDTYRRPFSEITVSIFESTMRDLGIITLKALELVENKKGVGRIRDFQFYRQATDISRIQFGDLRTNDVEKQVEFLRDWENDVNRSLQHLFKYGYIPDAEPKSSYDMHHIISELENDYSFLIIFLLQMIK